MSLEDDLSQLAQERDNATEAALDRLALEPPDRLLRQLRAYFARQVDYGRIARTDEKILQLRRTEGGLDELVCPRLEFSSGGRLEFKLTVGAQQRGHFVRCFHFHVHLEPRRSIRMVRIHLKPERGRDPLTAPRCHMHIDDSQAHVPFPIMDPRLILHLICECIERDFGL